MKRKVNIAYPSGQLPLPICFLAVNTAYPAGQLPLPICDSPGREESALPTQLDSSMTRPSSWFQHSIRSVSRLTQSWSNMA